MSIKKSSILLAFLICHTPLTANINLLIKEQLSHGLDYADRNKLLQITNLLVDFYRQKLSFNMPQEINLEIIVYKNFDEYRHQKPDIKKNKTCYYSSRTNKIYLWQERKKVLDYPVIIHEIALSVFNLLISDKSVKNAIWLRNGLAIYFENLTLEENIFIIQPDPIREKRLKKNFKQVSLKKLFTTKKQKKKSEMPLELKNDLTWAIIYYLMESEKGLQLLKHLINYVMDYPKQKNLSLEAVNSFFAAEDREDKLKGIDILERDFKFWLYQPKNPHRLEPFQK